MTNKQFEELGKGSINLGNLIGGFSIINTIFNKNIDTPSMSMVIFVFYIFITLYITGTLFIGLSDNKESK